MKAILKTHVVCQIWHRVHDVIPIGITSGDRIWFDSLEEYMTIEEMVWRIDRNEVIVWLEDWSKNEGEVIDGWVKGDR
jgi:hypothetical protein